MIMPPLCKMRDWGPIGFAAPAQEGERSTIETPCQYPNRPSLPPLQPPPQAGDGGLFNLRRSVGTLPRRSQCMGALGVIA